MDNDGRIDAVVTVLQGNAQYFHNVSQQRKSLDSAEIGGREEQSHGIGSAGADHHRCGSVQYNHATTSTGYACSSDPARALRSGPSKVIKEIGITWPSGIHQTLQNVAADQIVTVTEKADQH